MLAHAQAKKAPAVLVFKTYDEPMVSIEGNLNEAAIVAFVESSTEPSLPEMDERPRNKKAVGRIFADQDKPKLLAVVGEVRSQGRHVTLKASAKDSMDYRGVAPPLHHDPQKERLRAAFACAQGVLG